MSRSIRTPRGSSRRSGPTPRCILTLEPSITARPTGFPISSWLLRNLRSRQPASVEVLALLRKPDAAQIQVPVKYMGFDIPSVFVVGYGLDYAERYRELPYVGTLRPEVYSDAVG